MIIEKLPQKYHFIEASSCAELVKLLTTQEVHHVILDMSLSGGNIFYVFRSLTDYFQRANILIYSMIDESVYAKRLLQKGARGFVSKQSNLEELEAAIKSILRGEIYLSPRLKEVLFHATKKDMMTNPVDLLSDRELEVVEYIAQGRGAKEIAVKMNLDITTVSTYRK